MLYTDRYSTTLGWRIYSDTQKLNSDAEVICTEVLHTEEFGKTVTVALQRKSTIHDIAQLAGVSRATVSRYLNGHRWVSDDAAEKIRAAIEQTHYVANTHARALATGKANSVAFLLGEPQKLLFEDPNFASLLRAVADELGKRNQSFLMMTTDNREEEQRNLQYLQAGHVDGVIQVAWHQDSSSMIRGLVDAGIPTVIAEYPSDTTLPIGYVNVEDYGGARKAVEYLLQHGAQRIAMISGPKGPSGTRDRVRGFMDALSEAHEAVGQGVHAERGTNTAHAHLPADTTSAGREEAYTPAVQYDNAYLQSHIVYGDYGAHTGEECMAQLLERDPDIDAVFVSSDAMAVGAIRTLRAYGKSIPDDIQIIGFDDSSAAKLADPPLTTIRQPFNEIGKHLVNQLMQIIAGERPVGVTLPCELVVRGSTR